MGNLYLPRVKLYDRYPVGQRSGSGGVSDSRGAFLNGWHLSTDIGCAYMCIDGLSAYFEVTKTAEVKKVVDVLTDGFVNIPYLQISMYEALFCCTMRYCEALKFAAQYRDGIVSSGDILQDEYGRIFLGNKLLAEDTDRNFPFQEEYIYRNKRLIEIPAFVENSSAKLKIVHEMR